MNLIPGLLTTVDTTATATVGSRCRDKNDYEYIYLPGVTSCAVGSVVEVSHDGTTYTTTLFNETDAAKGRILAIAISAVSASTSYGWFQMTGLAEVAFGAAATAGAVLYAHASTAGTLDDTGTTKVHGITLIDTVSDAGNYTCLINYPLAV